MLQAVLVVVLCLNLVVTVVFIYISSIRVDANIRLPNWSVCPPRYDPTAWWRLNTIQSATFQVLDLESFCHALGRAANIHSHVKDVKVGTMSPCKKCLGVAKAKRGEGFDINASINIELQFYFLS